MTNSFVILVDKNDSEKGLMEKMEAHQKGELHRAFSIFIFNSTNELLLQKRATSKYHSGGLWTNTCCSHPAPGTLISEEAEKRLFEEMGFTTSLRKIFSFIYKAELDNGLTEYEFDHVFTGLYDGHPNINSEEVEDWKFIKLEDLKLDIIEHPERYTKWFLICFPKIEQYVKENR
ncbi:isopentenyl-diphosphate Delta-isomerase [Sporocytophaga myxococcoides]|uniref:isopentenyl-diphosphate Delta-isomerase n=1 Tax=Sporocytophaga myxococcoides TaxID=153721 RepID=UPI000414D8B7|nr:isopentenyl-diphosphate Delta-isomerase [Sporocytophaga myxococcoides]